MRAQGNLSALLSCVPPTAVMVDLCPDSSPDLASARDVPAESVPVRAHMLVRPGEQVPEYVATCCDCCQKRACLWHSTQPQMREEQTLVQGLSQDTCAHLHKQYADLWERLYA